MKYCRFTLDNQIHYGAVEERKGELWITVFRPCSRGKDLAFRACAARRSLCGIL